MALADYALAFRSRKIGPLLLLGFASGLPLALTAGTLQAWLAAENVDIVAIGWFALVGQPYTYIPAIPVSPSHKTCIRRRRSGPTRPP